MRPPDEHVALNITKKCNQRCVFCFEGDREEWSEPPLAEVERLLQEAATRYDNVIFMGAEALLRRDIGAVVRRAAELGLRVSAFTNGRALCRAGLIEELWQGLSALDDHDVRHPDRAIAVSPNTLLSAMNLG